MAKKVTEFILTSGQIVGHSKPTKTLKTGSSIIGTSSHTASRGLKSGTVLSIPRF